MTDPPRPRPMLPAAPHSLAGPRTVVEPPPPRAVVRSFTHAVEAHVAHGHLRSLGIAAELQDQHVVGVAGHLSHAVGGIKLWVPGAELERARDALEHAHEGVPDEEELADLALKDVPRAERALVENTSPSSTWRNAPWAASIQAAVAALLVLRALGILGASVHVGVAGILVVGASALAWRTARAARRRELSGGETRLEPPRT